MKARSSGCARILFTNQKGGVGKTTLCRELGLYLAKREKTVLFVDTDPQANLSRSLVAELPETGLYEALTGEQYAVTELREGLHLLSGSIRLALLEKQLLGEVDAYNRLRDLIENELFTAFEYIFIDSPPTLGVLTVNALAAATHLLIPMNPAIYSMQGTNDLLSTVNKVRKTLNPELSLLGFIVNEYNGKPVITRQIVAEIREAFEGKVFDTMLSQSIRIEEAIAARRSVTELTGAGKTKEEVERLADELVFTLRLNDPGNPGPSGDMRPTREEFEKQIRKTTTLKQERPDEANL